MWRLLVLGAEAAPGSGLLDQLGLGVQAMVRVTVRVRPAHGRI